MPAKKHSAYREANTVSRTSRLLAAAIAAAAIASASAVAATAANAAQAPRTARRRTPSDGAAPHWRIVAAFPKQSSINDSP